MLWFSAPLLAISFENILFDHVWGLGIDGKEHTRNCFSMMYRVAFILFEPWFQIADLFYSGETTMHNAKETVSTYV